MILSICLSPSAPLQFDKLLLPHLIFITTPLFVCIIHHSHARYWSHRDDTFPGDLLFTFARFGFGVDSFVARLLI